MIEVALAFLMAASQGDRRVTPPRASPPTSAAPAATPAPPSPSAVPAAKPSVPSPLPGWLLEFIAARQRQRLSEPALITRYEYRGQQVYFYPSRCCDVPSRLYAADGKMICAPDGGFTGRGDGQCPDFFTERKKPVVVWHDPRSEPYVRLSSAFYQTWVRSLEEETPSDRVQVFRPRGTRAFPRGRFRMTYEFFVNGACTYLPPGASDTQGAKPGFWDLDHDRAMLIRIVEDDRTEAFSIVELSPTVLRLMPIVER